MFTLFGALLVDMFSHELVQDPFTPRHVSKRLLSILLMCFPGIEPMFDRCHGVCFGLLFTSDNDLGRSLILPYGTISLAAPHNFTVRNDFLGRDRLREKRSPGCERFKKV